MNRRAARWAGPMLAFALSAMSGGCTLVKPVVGALTGPVIVLGGSDGDFLCGCNSGEGAVCIVAGLAVVGAAAGLVTGVISDVQWLRGVPERPTDNWWDPFATNTSEGAN